MDRVRVRMAIKLLSDMPTLLDGIRSAHPDLVPCVVDMIHWWSEEGIVPTACAVGHLMLHPWFEAQEFRAVVSDGGQLYPEYDNGWGTVHTGWAALSAFFDIERSVAFHVFGQDTLEDCIAELKKVSRQGRAMYNGATLPRAFMVLEGWTNYAWRR